MVVNNNFFAYDPVVTVCLDKFFGSCRVRDRKGGNKFMPGNIFTVAGQYRFVREEMTPDAIVKWQEKLARVLRSGDELAILNCTCCIEAMEMLIGEREEDDPSGMQ